MSANSQSNNDSYDSNKTCDCGVKVYEDWDLKYESCTVCNAPHLLDCELQKRYEECHWDKFMCCKCVEENFRKAREQQEESERARKEYEAYYEKSDYEENLDEQSVSDS